MQINKWKILQLSKVRINKRFYIIIITQTTKKFKNALRVRKKEKKCYKRIIEMKEKWIESY